MSSNVKSVMLNLSRNEAQFLLSLLERTTPELCWAFDVDKNSEKHISSLREKLRKPLKK